MKLNRLLRRLEGRSGALLNTNFATDPEEAPRGPLPAPITAAATSRRAVRQAAALFIAAGIIGFASDLLPGGIDNRTTTSLVLDAFNLGVGLICWNMLTRRLLGYRSVVLALFAMADIATNNALGLIPATTLGIWFVVIFVWVGAWHPPRITFLMAPPAIAAYLVPFAFGAPRPTGAAESVILIVPVAVLVGLTIAANAGNARKAHAEQQRALTALARANVTDDLTGLGNRRFGNELLDGLRPGDVVAIFDLDNFKTVNDRWGHSQGDRVLQDLGAFFADSASDRIAIARMGGEEFMLVFHQTAPIEAAQQTQFIVSSWSESSPLSTLSAGVASHRYGQSPSRTYRLADEALYRAKMRGRDQIATSDDIVCSE